MAYVKVWDQGTWNRYELHEDGTWNGVYGPPIHYMNPAYLRSFSGIPLATKPFNGAPIVIFQGQRYTARNGPNVFD